MSTQTIDVEQSSSSSKSSKSHKSNRKHRSNHVKAPKNVEIIYDDKSIIDNIECKINTEKCSFSRLSYFSVSDTHRFRSMVVPVSKMPDPLPIFIIKIRQLENNGSIVYFQWPNLTGKLGIETEYVYLSQSVSGSPNLEISSSLALYINNQPTMGSIIVNPFAEQSVKFYLSADRTKYPISTDFLIPAGSINWYSQ